jgi:hypothetical protein
MRLTISSRSFIAAFMIAIASSSAANPQQERPPSHFLLFDDQIELILQCPWDNRRVYSLSGSGEFHFLAIARSEDPSIKPEIREWSGIADSERVAYVTRLLLESSFQYLPEIIEDYSYSVREGVVSSGEPFVSTACDTEISLAIEDWQKTVKYATSRLYPRTFVRQMQSLVGEYES